DHRVHVRVVAGDGCGVRLPRPARRTDEGGMSMPRTTTAREIDSGLLEDLLGVSAHAPNADLKVELAQSVRAATRDASRMLDRALFEQQQRMADGLERAQAAQEELRALLGRLAAPPWHPATFLSTVATRLGTRAMVLYNGARRIVSAGDGV